MNSRRLPIIGLFVLVSAVTLAGCAVSSPSGDDSAPADNTPQEQAPAGLFDGLDPAGLGANLETAGIDPGAAATCQSVLPGIGNGMVSAVPATFGDALDASVIFQSDPNWPYAVGDDNRMTVKLRDEEDPEGSTAICTFALEAGGYTRDVAVIFSDGTWGEIGAY